jgi:hypothetical protein
MSEITRPGGVGAKTVNPVSLRLTAAAKREIEKSGHPLVVHLELLFSCMLRKQVRFPDTPHPDAFPLDCDNSNIRAEFRAIGTKSCVMSEQPVPDHETFPLNRVEPFMPKWLSLDFRAGHWRGEFGYASDQ